MHDIEKNEYTYYFNISKDLNKTLYYDLPDDYWTEAHIFKITQENWLEIEAFIRLNMAERFIKDVKYDESDESNESNESDESDESPTKKMKN